MRSGRARPDARGEERYHVRPSARSMNPSTARAYEIASAARRQRERFAPRGVSSSCQVEDGARRRPSAGWAGISGSESRFAPVGAVYDVTRNEGGPRFESARQLPVLQGFCCAGNSGAGLAGTKRVHRGTPSRLVMWPLSLLTFCPFPGNFPRLRVRPCNGRSRKRPRKDGRARVSQSASASRQTPQLWSPWKRCAMTQGDSLAVRASCASSLRLVASPGSSLLGSPRR